MPFVTPDFDLDFGVDGSNGDDLDVIDSGWSAAAIATNVLEKAGGQYLVSDAVADDGSDVAFYGHSQSAVDASIEGTFYIASSGYGSYYSLGLRYSITTFSGYIVRYSSTGQWVLDRYDSGVPTQLGSWSETPTNGSTRVVRLSAVGSTIKVYVDGVERISVTDSTYSTAAGFVVASAGRATASVGQILKTLTGGVWVEPVVGDLGASLQPLTTNLTGTYAAPVTATLGAELEPLEATFTGTYNPPVTGTLGASLEPLTATLTGTYIAPTIGTLGATLEALTANLTGTFTELTYAGDLAAALEPITANLTATYNPPVTGTLGAELEALTATLTGTFTEPAGYEGTLAATLEALTANLTGAYVAPVVGTLGATLDPLTATLTGTFALYAFPLKVGATTISVRPGGHRAREVPMAPEVVYGIDGTAYSGITAYRGYRTRVSIEMEELDASDALSLYAALDVGTPLSFTGYLVGGSLTGVVRNLRWIPGDIDRALAFEIVQSA